MSSFLTGTYCCSPILFRDLPEFHVIQAHVYAYTRDIWLKDFREHRKPQFSVRRFEFEVFSLRQFSFSLFNLSELA